MLISAIDGIDILFPDGRREIRDGSDRPASFIGGWRPTLAYRGLGSVTIVPFESDAGGTGCWFLDGAMRRQGGSIDELPPWMRADLLTALCPLLDGIWQQIMLESRPHRMTEEQKAFFALPVSLRLSLLDFYLRTFDPDPDWRAVEAIGPATAQGDPVLDCGTRRLPLIGGELHWLLRSDLLQSLFDRLLAEGALAFRSPCSGAAILCRKALALGSGLIAYKLYDEEWDLSFFVLAGGIYNTSKALYFPEAKLAVGHDPAGLRVAQAALGRRFHQHIAAHGAELFGYLANDRVWPVHFWGGRTSIHLGHVIWNDYSGIERMLAAGEGTPPNVLVCESGSGPEMYGPLDEVFPALRGKVVRESEPFVGLVSSLYEKDALLFRTSAMSVNRSLRESVLRLVPVKTAEAPVLILGLRTENRTATDLARFCTSLVRHLAERYGPVTLVVDGHNRRDDGGTIWSHGELEIAGSPMQAELALLERISEAAAGTQVSIVSTIGEPLRESLGWARAARSFVAFWGAGLAKYRWIGNVPGLIITSRWNLEHLGDLRIYSSEEAMEQPTPVSFCSTDAIEDRPDAPVMIAHALPLAPSLWNFDLDVPAVLRAFDQAVGDRLSP